MSWILSYLSVRLQKVAIVKKSLEEGASILEYHKDPSCYISARQNGVTHGWAIINLDVSNISSLSPEKFQNVFAKSLSGE